MKNSKKITVFLFITLLAIWGSIGYQIFSAVDSEGPDDVVATVEPQPTEDREESIDFDHARDPFRYVVPKVRKEPVKPASAQMWVPPPFRLVGIVLKEKERMAVLESMEGSTYFLAEGETINGVKLVKILEQAVTYTYMNETRDWVLAR